MSAAERTIAVILGGGVGSRLYPLTKDRSKPAVPIAGKFRLIDIPISNCLNSNIRRMFVLTQFNSASLNKHLKNAYTFDKFSNAFVDLLAAEQTRQHSDWFQGTADAVRKSVMHLDMHDFDYVLLLSGDQLYQMDFREILDYHISKKADITVATIPVNAHDATGFGIMKVDDNGYIVDFVEKPHSEELEHWTSPVESIYAHEGKNFLASMGIYVFTEGILSKLFDEMPEAVDFGKQIIPYAVDSEDYTICSFPFGGYWTDIGSIPSFFDANLHLTEYLPQFNLYDNVNKVYTNTRLLSPTKIFGTRLDRTLVSEGAILHADTITNSIIGVRSRIGNRTVIESCIIMGLDYYQTLEDMVQSPDDLLGIGDDCYIKNTIIDKNAKIGNNCTIIGDNSLEDIETEHYCIKEGIIIINKGGVIPSFMQ